MQFLSAYHFGFITALCVGSTIATSRNEFRALAERLWVSRERIATDKIQKVAGRLLSWRGIDSEAALPPRVLQTSLFALDFARAFYPIMQHSCFGGQCGEKDTSRFSFSTIRKSQQFAARSELARMESSEPNGNLNGMEQLRLLQETVGASHPQTLQHMHDLVQTCRAQNDLENAETIQRELLDALSDKFGGSHTILDSSKNNLAIILLERGDLHGAETMLQEVLDAHMQNLEHNHPATLDCKNNLAMVLAELGKLSEAFAMQTDVVSARSRILGAEHPLTLRSKQNLASILRRRGDFDFAVELLNESLKCETKSDQERLAAKNNLATLLHCRGDVEDASSLQQDAMESYERVYGPNHRDTLTSKSNLASTLHKGAINKIRNEEPAEAMRDLKKAERIHRIVLDLRASTLGYEHPDTLESKASLASTMFYSGKQDLAVNMQKEALETWSRKFGLEYPRTLLCKFKLAKMLQASNREGEADRLYQQVLDSQQKDDLVQTLDNGGNSGHAIKLSQDIFERSFQKSIAAGDDSSGS